MGGERWDGGGSIGDCDDLQKFSFSEPTSVLCDFLDLSVPNEFVLWRSVRITRRC